jgi:hypothetical protein
MARRAARAAGRNRRESAAPSRSARTTGSEWGPTQLRINNRDCPRSLLLAGRGDGRMAADTGFSARFFLDFAGIQVPWPLVVTFNVVCPLSRPSVLRTVGGKVPTYEEAVSLIQEAGGTIQRVEGSHAGSAVAGHIDFAHINYTTAGGTRSHLAFQPTAVYQHNFVGPLQPGAVYAPAP